MNSNSKDSKPSKRYFLEKTYSFNAMWYSLSFKQRLMIKLRWMTYPQFLVSEKVKQMTDEELEEAIKYIKKPWWDKIVLIFGI